MIVKKMIVKKIIVKKIIVEKIKCFPMWNYKIFQKLSKMIKNDQKLSKISDNNTVKWHFHCFCMSNS